MARVLELFQFRSQFYKIKKEWFFFWANSLLQHEYFERGRTEIACPNSNIFSFSPTAHERTQENRSETGDFIFLFSTVIFSAKQSEQARIETDLPSFFPWEASISRQTILRSFDGEEKRFLYS